MEQLPRMAATTRVMVASMWIAYGERRPPV